MTDIVLCPLCKVPSPERTEGEVCPQHPQRVFVSQGVLDEHASDMFIGLLLDGKYELCKPLGHGGFGSVYYAVQRGQIRREVAIKLLTRQSPEYLDLFRDEMRMVAQLRSPYTVRYLDSGVHADAQLNRELPYMVMEYLKGQTLAHRLINQGAIPPAEAIELFDHLLDSLDEAHSFGIVHRDLKPLNLMITPTRQGGARLTVLDFGVARVIDQASRDATRNRIMGTPYYLAPEVLLQQEVTPQGDLFAVGVILYETLMCRSPFLNEELQGVEPYLKLRNLYKSESKYEPISSQFEAAFSSFFDRALAVSTERRFQDAGEMRKALSKCLKKLSPPQGLKPQDTQFDLPKIELKEDTDSQTVTTLSAQKFKVQLQSDDQTLLTQSESPKTIPIVPSKLPEPAKTVPLFPQGDELPKPSTLSSSSTSPSPFPKPSPSPSQAPSAEGLNSSAQFQAPNFDEDESLETLQTRPILPISDDSAGPKRQLPLIIGASVALLGVSFMLLQGEPVNPCVLTRSPSVLSPSMLEGELKTPPPVKSIIRLRSASIRRTCLTPDEEGCQEGVITCPLESVYTQTQALTSDDFARCQQAGMCDSDSSPQGALVQRCSEGSDELCVPALAAYKYCSWRGLMIPTLNTWHRMSQERELRGNNPQWTLSPSGELLRLSPLYQIDPKTKELGALSSLELKRINEEVLTDNTIAPTASIRCVRAYKDQP